ncbi:MAG: type II toxin-antitoxin system RelE/ParE family toxin [Actinobacteria bacterium]|nr:type II toxin-antitoxin system RelE/ParE family toxin [Actinomycetota bacterium]
MPYEINYTDEFGEWWDGLSIEQQEAIIARVELLEEHGPALGRPTVDRVNGSAFHNMKELRCSSSGTLRVLFAFDPRQEAILLLGGDKSGDWDAWYDEAIPAADALYAEYLRSLRREGIIE